MKSVLPILVLSFFALTSCLENQVSSSSSSGGSTDNFNIDDGGGGSGTGGTGGSGGGSTCYGNQDDGDYSAAQRLHFFDIMLAGGQSWYPGLDNDGHSPAIPDVYAAKNLFTSDSSPQIRFKIASAPLTEDCFGKESGAADSVPYSKLKFDIRLRDVECDSSGNNCSLKSTAYGHQTDIGPVSAGECSPIITLGNRNSTSDGTVVEIYNVRSDSECEYCKLSDSNCPDPDRYCPSDQLVRAQSCWKMRMQISTDYNDNFK